MTTTISSKGQITVPAEIRKAIGLHPGTRMELRLGPKGTFVASKKADRSFFDKFRGMAKKGSLGASKDAMMKLRGAVEKGDVD